MSRPSTPTARALRAVLATLLLCACAAGAARAGAPPAAGRLIVLGFDGADARTVEEMIARGELPALAKLAEQGTFAPLATTMPAESPVSWAALNSGQNPGKTGVPGFVRRELGKNGRPMPAVGFYDTVTRPLAELDAPAHLAFLGRQPPAAVAAEVGLAVAVAFALLFGLLLRIRRSVALPLALALGALGAWAGHAASGYVPRTISEIVANRSQVGGFWEVAAQAGVPCIVIDGAMAWDRPRVENARVLAGLGLPDARGAYGDWFVYTTDEKEFDRVPEGRSTATGGKVFRVDEIEGRVETRLYGPKDLWRIDVLERERDAIRARLAEAGLPDSQIDALRAREREIERKELAALDDFSSEGGRLSVPLVVTRADGGELRVAVDGHEQALREGAWSTWYAVRFEANPLFDVRAITRVKVDRAREPLRLFVDFVHIDPSAPPFWQPASQPPEFAGELARAIEEPYETVGWACLTMPFKDREIDPVTFLQDIDATRVAREKLLHAALARDDWRALVFVESTPDRVQHMCWQFSDPAHPLHDAQKAATATTFAGEEIALSGAIAASYRALDRLVGQVVERHLRPEDTLIVCSDHGFQSFRRQVHLNNWLAEQGYLALVDGVSRAQGSGLMFVDWPRTRAYALGLGGIYLNLEGREGEGTVAPADAAALLDEIERKLLAAEDPEGGAKLVREVYRSAEIHSGEHVRYEPDLLVGFDAGYRVGWSTTGGGIRLVQGEDKSAWLAGPFVEDNANNWSGDHVSVAEPLVRGVFLSNRPVLVPEQGLDLLDVAPTALAVLGVAVPAEYDRPALRFSDGR